jgi:hypothetical protein
MIDLRPAPSNMKKLRKDWGLQNVIGMEHANRALMSNNAHRIRKVRHKVANFTQNAIYPQQLTIPRQYATTTEGTFIYKILEDREVDRVAGGGVRVVVQENAQQARFIMSPLFGSKQDALGWAARNTGATL